MTTANEIAFGIEFETTLSITDTTYVGDYHHGEQVDWLPQGWKAERDSSITTGLGRKCCEFVSPKLRGSDGLQQVVDSLEKIRSHGAKVNESCGLHITVEWNGDASALARLISLVGNHEKALYASTGTHRRENTMACHYCKPLKAYGNKEDAKLRCESDRMHVMNLTHLARGSNRIEFRLFAGTLNTEKVIGYVMMMLGIVELALKSTRCPDWNATPTGKRHWDRIEGHGQRELARLFYRLNWKRGYYSKGYKYANTTFGSLAGFSLVTSMNKLMEMGKKYDLSA